MRLVKPLVAIVAAGLISPAFAAYGAHASKAARGCSKVVNHAANINSPKSGVQSAACWYNRVTVSGAVNALFSSKNVKDGLTSTTTDKFDVNNANLFIDAKLNRDVTAHVNLRHYSAANDSGLAVDEAYVNYSNFAGSPVFVKFGKGYLDFGNNADPYAVAPSLTQMLTQHNETQLALGFASNTGMNASVFVYGHKLADEAKDRINKFGARFGYNGRFDSVNYNFNASMINDARTPSNNVMMTTYSGGAFDTVASSKESAYNVNLGLNYMNVDMGLNYTAFGGDLSGADTKPAVFGVDAGYKFDMGGYKARLGGSYEKGNTGGQTAFTAKSRTAVGYSVSLSPNVDMNFDYATYKQHNGSDKVRFLVVGLKGHM